MTPSEPDDVDALLESTIKDIGIPPRPAILDRIAAEMRKDAPDFKQLAHIIGSDVSLAATLIKTANSPYFGIRHHVRNTGEALLVLGLDVASRAIAGIVLRKVFPSSPQLERFWDASAHIARLSGWLAQMLGLPKLRADDAYTYGLFRDCGIPVMLRRFPAYGATLGQANDEAGRAFTDVEQDGFPTNHAMIGCLLAQNWWLPEEICLAIRHHHDLTAIEDFESGLPSASRNLIAAAQLAEHLLQHQTGLSRTQEWPKLGAACLRLLDLTPGQLPTLYEEATAILEAE